MVNRLRQSLALRLALLNTLVFVLGATALFGVLYWELAAALEARERAAVEGRAEDLARAYAVGGVAGLRGQLGADGSEEARALFIRLIAPDGATAFVNVPPDWIDPQGSHVLVPDGWGGWNAREVHSVRVPRDAARDLAVSSRALGDGRLLQVARSTDSRAVLLAPLRRAFAETGGAALLVAMALGIALAWRATRPLRAVAATTRSILETGDLSARVPPPRGSGELAVLVRQLNTLLDKNTEHVRVLRETLDNLAHDLRTPLTRLRGTAELALAGGADPAEGREALADCIEQSDRVLHLLERLLDVSAAEAGALKLDRAMIDLRSLVEHAVELYREVAEERAIAVTLEQPTAAPVEADAVRLGQAISNLLDNALKYTPPGGRVQVATSTEAGAVRLVISDTGPGVPVAERGAIWRRLYRGDASRSQRGLGLGLSLVRAIAEAHGGTVAVDDSPGGGARFTVRIPAVPAPAL
jgi:signal transduction histidine kinase